MMADRTFAERIRAALPVIVIHVLLGFVLLNGLDYTPPALRDEVLKVIDLPPEAVPPPVEEPPAPPPMPGPQQAERQADPRPEGAASPPNLEARPTPVVAPPPVVPLPVPPPIRAAPVPGTGREASAGAAPIPGPGTGSGGVGNGLGSGRGGGGMGGGGGGGGGGMSPPRWIRGSMSIRDLPREVEEFGAGGVVSVRYAVEVDGRVTNCSIMRSSGSRALDSTTCRLIEQRFRYIPSRDRTGRPIRSQIVQDHFWEIEDLPRERSRRRRDDW